MSHLEGVIFAGYHECLNSIFVTMAHKIADRNYLDVRLIASTIR
jgi:hypothetical protein